MKKYLLMLMVILFMATTLGHGADIAGQSDTTYRIDYVGSFFDRVANYTSTPWKIDGDSSKVETAINDARLEITNRFIDASQRKDTIVTTTAAWYALNSDCIDIARVAENDPVSAGSEIGLDSIRIADIGKKTSSNDVKPKYYAVWANKVYFDRNNQTGDSLFIYYRARANKLIADSTICNLTKKYYELVVEIAIINFFSSRGGAGVERTIARAEKRIAQILGEMNLPEINQTPEILR